MPDAVSHVSSVDGGQERRPQGSHRIEDDIGHIRTNVEFKIYLFSNRAKLSRKLFIQIFLSQGRVPLSDEVRANAQADIDALP